jgi:hypothetical protein
MPFGLCVAKANLKLAIVAQRMFIAMPFGLCVAKANLKLAIVAQRMFIAIIALYRDPGPRAQVSRP